MSRFAGNLQCEICGERHSVGEWPVHGDRIPFCFEERPGNFSVSFKCPKSGSVRYIVWDKDPGPIQAFPPANATADTLAHRFPAVSTSNGRSISASVEGKASREPQSKCPSCRSSLDEQAVICIQCGYDLRTGNTVKSSPVRKKRRRPDSSERSPLEPLAKHVARMSWSLAAFSLLFLICGPALFYGAALSTAMIRASHGKTDFFPLALTGIVLFAVAPLLALGQLTHSLKFVAMEPLRALAGMLVSVVLICAAAAGWYFGPMKGSNEDLRARIARFWTPQADASQWHNDFESLLSNIPPVEAHLTEADLRNGKVTDLFGQLQDGAEVTFTTVRVSYSDSEGPEISPGSTVRNGVPVLVVIREEDHPEWASIPAGTTVRYRGNLELRSSFISGNGSVRPVRSVIIHVNEILEPASTFPTDPARVAAFRAIAECRKVVENLRPDEASDLAATWHILLGKPEGPASGSKCLPAVIESRIAPADLNSESAAKLDEGSLELRSGKWTDANNLRLAAALNLAIRLEPSQHPVLENAVIAVIFAPDEPAAPVTSIEDADKQLKQILSGLGRTPHAFSEPLLLELLKTLPSESALTILKSMAAGSRELRELALRHGTEWAQSAFQDTGSPNNDRLRNAWQGLQTSLKD